MRAYFAFVLVISACGKPKEVAYVTIQNDFNNSAPGFQPPWTICHASYLGEDFGAIAIGASSAEKQVDAGLDFVLMVAAWNDPTCAKEHALPLASKMEEEVVSGQHRTIAINVASHQGACPPEGVPPVDEATYNRIAALWPEFDFKPYAERTQNTQCLSR